MTRFNINYKFLAWGAVAGLSASVFYAETTYAKPKSSFFSDENFYRCVVNAYKQRSKSVANYDVGNVVNVSADEMLTVKQLAKIKTVICSDLPIYSTNGIEKLTALKTLRLNNDRVTALDVSKNTKLTELSLQGNQLQTLNLSKNTALTKLNASMNQLTNVDLSRNTKLKEVNLYGNKLSALGLKNNAKLESLELSQNNLASLDLSGLKKLKSLGVQSNGRLKELDVSKNTKLEDLRADNIQLATAATATQNGATYALNLSKLKFYKDYDSIGQTGAYDYNAQSKILLSKDYEKLAAYMNTAEGYPAATYRYRLKLPKAKSVSAATMKKTERKVYGNK